MVRRDAHAREPTRPAGRLSAAQNHLRNCDAVFQPVDAVFQPAAQFVTQLRRSLATGYAVGQPVDAVGGAVAPAGKYSPNWVGWHVEARHAKQVFHFFQS